jgi:lipoate-protein ligase A
MMDSCRVFLFDEADGPANMARDEALLEAAAADPSSAYFRTYGWTIPTLSLGYFQSITDAEHEPRWRSVPIVRRPTGGGAIWHHHELTYALAVPGEHPFARRSRDLYRAVHAALTDLLREHGVSVQRYGSRGEEGIGGTRPFLCFTDRDEEDIVAEGSKVIGSAQRRRSGAVLQHGAMMLAPSDITPELPGPAELPPVFADPRYWSARLNDRIPAILNLKPEISPLPRPLTERARVLEETVYRTDRWTRKR